MVDAMRRRLAPLVVLLAALAVVSVGCAGDSGGGTKAGAKVDIPASKFEQDTGQRNVAVHVVDNDFEAPYIVVTAGTKVEWTNDGRNPHNVTPANTGAFTAVPTDQFSPGQSYSVTFGEAGDYPYYCSIHGTKNLNGQSGVIRVVAKSGS
jgi:plastocyanin